MTQQFSAEHNAAIALMHANPGLPYDDAIAIAKRQPGTGLARATLTPPNHAEVVAYMLEHPGMQYSEALAVTEDGAGNAVAVEEEDHLAACEYLKSHPDLSYRQALVIVQDERSRREGSKSSGRVETKTQKPGDYKIGPKPTPPKGLHVGSGKGGL